MTKKIVTLASDSLRPYTVGFIQPTFYDRVRAGKSLGKSDNLGFNLTHLLFAMCLKERDGIPIPDNELNPIQKIELMPARDTQFLLAAFLPFCSLTEELSNDVETKVLDLREKVSPTYEIKGEWLPLKSIESIVFRTPTTKDQFDCDKLFPSSKPSVGYSSQEALFAKSIVSINGEDVTGQGIELFYKWYLIDQMYAQAMFATMNYLNDDEFNVAAELGKGLRTDFLVGLSGAVPSKVKSST
jgi:hypothetical protein